MLLDQLALLITGKLPGKRTIKEPPEKFQFKTAYDLDLQYLQLDNTLIFSPQATK